MPSGYGDRLERAPESTCPARDQNTHGISFPCWYPAGQPCAPSARSIGGYRLTGGYLPEPEQPVR